MTERDPRQRINPIKQQTLDTLPEDFRVGFSVSTSTVDTLAAIYQNEYETDIEGEESAITPEQLFQSFRGQQLHILNELMIMIVREVKRFYHKTAARFSSSELSVGDILLPVSLQFPPTLIKSYFPELKPEEVQKWSQILTTRIDEYPDIVPGDTAYTELQLGKKRVRRLKAIDIPQLVFDVWNDWRFNQTFSVKRGVVPNPERNANYFEMVKSILTQNTQIWEDNYQPKQGEIELDAIETLSAWRVVLSNQDLWQISWINHTIVAQLLDVRNRVHFEQLLNIRYLLDEVNPDFQTDAVLSAYISGQPDILLLIPTEEGGVQTLVIDIKSTLRNSETLETLIAKMQARVAPWIKPGSKSPAIMMASEFAEADLSEHEVIHINPLSIIQLAAGIYDFESEIQQTFNSYQDRALLEAIVQDATLHPKKYKDRILRHKRQNRVPVKHTFAEHLQSRPRKMLPSLDRELRQFFQDQEAKMPQAVELEADAPSERMNQPILPEIERVAIKVISAKTRKKLKRRSA